MLFRSKLVGTAADLLLDAKIQAVVTTTKVSSTDRSSFYKISKAAVGKSGVAGVYTVKLTGLSDDADLYVYDSAYKPLCDVVNNAVCWSEKTGIEDELLTVAGVKGDGILIVEVRDYNGNRYGEAAVLTVE